MLNASSPPQTQLRAGISSHAFLLALATFAIGTDAFIIAGILPQISHDLTVTISSAGLVALSSLFSRLPTASQVPRRVSSRVSSAMRPYICSVPPARFWVPPWS